MMHGGMLLQPLLTTLGNDLLPSGGMRVLLQSCHSWNSKVPTMTMNHSAGAQTPTTWATSFSPSLGEYVFFLSSSLYNVMLLLVQLVALWFLLVHNLKNPKRFMLSSFACCFLSNKNSKTKKICFLSLHACCIVVLFTTTKLQKHKNIFILLTKVKKELQKST
jgi:hypothetical protein